MRLKVACDLIVSAPKACPCVTMLRPVSGSAQWLVEQRHLFDPKVQSTEYVDTYGNLCQRVVLPAGKTRIRVDAVVDTETHISVNPLALPTPIEKLPDSALIFLLASRYCPSDQMAQKAQEISGRFPVGYPQVEAIRAWIHENIEYKYGVSSESTDAKETLRVGAGVCRDFAHIGMALCRSLRIPARMVVGYLYKLDPMDLHAWFEAYIGDRWYTFDATQTEPRGGRVVLAYGRDAADVAFISNYAKLETDEMIVRVDAVEDTSLPPMLEKQASPA